MISMRTVATVPARFAHRNVATNKYNSDNCCCQCDATQSRNERIPLARDICGSFQIGYRSFKFANSFAGPCQVQCEARTLHWIDYTKPIKVRSGACDIGAGAMLFQVIDGREVPVAFWSKAFTATERRWSTYEQETFALVASVLHWESLLLGHKFSVEIDHKNMQCSGCTSPTRPRW